MDGIPGRSTRRASDGGATTVAPGVAAIRLPRVLVHLLDDDPATLVDAGYQGAVGAIERGLAAQGRSLSEVARVICTHGHPDHAGGARALADRGVEVLMHPADAERLRTGVRTALRHPSRGRIFAAITPELATFTPIEDGDVLPSLGGLEVVHTPGHTPGSVCLYAARDRVLFVGDTLQRRRGRVTFASSLYSDDHAEARRSVRRLAELDVEVIVFSHFPPLRGNASGVLVDLARTVG